MENKKPRKDAQSLRHTSILQSNHGEYTDLAGPKYFGINRGDI